VFGGDTASYGEIRKFVDVFYEDPANAALPVMAALAVFTAKLNGRTPDALEAMLASFRQDYARAPK
jgi:hypothetical protein